MSNVTLDQHFNYRLLLKAVIPSIIMMIFTSLYSIVDGLFISRFAGKAAFAAVNLIFPYIMMVGGTGFMMGAGGSALVCKIRGEGDSEKANKIFGFLILCTLILGVIISVFSIVFIEPIGIALGADADMLPHVKLYGTIMLSGMALFMLQNCFQSFLRAAERPRLGLICTVGSGITNMIGDALLVGLFDLGVLGAGLATVSSYLVGTVIPLFLFLNKKSSCWLKLRSISFDFRALGRTVWNGLSELVSNIAMSVVGLLYNFELMKYFGEDGVAAYGVIMYVGFVFVAVFIGYSMGVA
ncbi:MAG: MATE family efflux transporter, partial [Bacilli bacterium]|nr:MATE family efflux transporter [Bacilli bacterium]